MAESAEAPVSGVLPHPGYRERYPWHQTAWGALMRDPARMPHALLLHGPEGLGKAAFAWRFAQARLCLSPDAEGAACGACRSCTHFASGTHPDLLHVTPLEDSRTIAIDQVRDLREFAALKAHTSARKLAILRPAEAMNLSSANALLKLLEEPPAGSMLVLVASQPARLPATIRSRCASVPLRPPPLAETSAWLRAQGVGDPAALLALSGGAPLLALDLAAAGAPGGYERFLEDMEGLRAGTEDPLRCAARWKNHGAPCCLSWLQRYLGERIRTELGREGGRKNLRHVRDLFGYLDVVSETKALVPGPLDESLLLEDISVAAAQLFRKMD